MAYTGFDIQGKVVLVTGGTSGIGRAIALGCAKAGAKVVAGSTNPDKVATSKKELGGDHDAVAMNVSDEATVKAAFDHTIKRYGRVDAVVHAAGVIKRQPSLEMPVEEFRRIIDVNLTGTFIVNQAAGRAMHTQEPNSIGERGSIVNIASLNSYISLNEVLAYASSKSGVLGIIRGLANEWAHYGIRVNGIAPGVVETDLNRKLINGTPRGNFLKAHTPQNRFGAADEMVGAAIYLISPSACYTNGHTIVIDGGFLTRGVGNPQQLKANMNFSKYSMGIGDRFAHQGKAQLAAFVKAKELGVEVTPVWNKSNREHLIVHSEPTGVRTEADAAVKALGWKGAYFVDADHIGLKTVDRFVAPSDFFTIDVADFIGKPAVPAEVSAFVAEFGRYAGAMKIAGIDGALDVTKARIEAIAGKYLFAVQEAGKVYRHIETAKGKGKFVPEISMDETDQPQTPIDLLFILAAIAREKIPVQTIAPKFTGRFNKGVDYVGNVAQFEKEFNDDLAVIAFAVKEFGLPADLKLSVHSGSDKFSIYPAIRRAIQRTGAGLHIKTAGTTWLEELIGLASAGPDGLAIAKEVYAQALDHFDELCGPYASVIDIDKSRLPSAQQVASWSGQQYAQTLRHDQKRPEYNPHVRQLLHVGYKVAANMGEHYTKALEQNESVVAANVTENLFDRHLRPIFLGK